MNLSSHLLTPQPKSSKTIAFKKSPMKSSGTSSQKSILRHATEPDQYTLEAEASRKEYLTSSRLPAVADLINLRPKYKLLKILVLKK